MSNRLQIVVESIYLVNLKPEGRVNTIDNDQKEKRKKKDRGFR